MRPLLAIILGVSFLIWSALAWGVHALVGAAPAAAATITRWFALPPGTLQWLGDAVSVAQGPIQVIVFAVWALGALGLAALAVLLPRMADDAVKLGREAGSVARAVRAGERPTLDPAVTRPFRDR